MNDNSTELLRVIPSGIFPSRIGTRVTVVSPSNVYGCELEDDVFIGPFTEVQKGVHIGARTRIQSHSFICELVSIGEDCFVGHGVCFINDKLQKGPARGDKSKWLETKIGNRVSIGSNATILPVSVCDDVVIGAGAVVVSDIITPGTYVGNPARRI